MGFLLLKGFLQYFFNCFYNLQFKLLSPLWHWLGWIHRQQILGYTCVIWRSMPSFYEVVDLKSKKTADWYICESFVSLKTWNYNTLLRVYLAKKKKKKKWNLEKNHRSFQNYQISFLNRSRCNVFLQNLLDLNEKVRNFQKKVLQ